MLNTRRNWVAMAVLSLSGMAMVPAAQAVGPGYGVLGDSFADEYEFYPPDRSQARNFVELLSSDRDLNFGSFTTVSRGEPRDQGYAYDWALSGAESKDLPEQTAGLAQQVAAGQVKTAFMFVGGNDFIDALESPNPQTILPTIPQALLTNVLTSATTILAANPSAGIVISNVLDISTAPIIQQALAAGLVTQTELNDVSQLINGYNEALAAAVANNPRIGIVDVNTLGRQILAAPTFSVDGVTLDRTTPGDQYTHLFLADGLHLGTVGQGLLANAFADVADKQLGAGITPLSDSEIIASAKGVPTPVPLPRGLAMAAAGLIFVGAYTAMRSHRQA